MLRTTPQWLKIRFPSKKRPSALSKRHRTNGNKFFPAQQLARQQEDRQDHMTKGRITPHRVQKVMHETSRMNAETDRYNSRTALQGLGDNESLAANANFGVKLTDVMAHNDQVASHVAPPETYTKLMSRKLAEGKFWPSVRSLDDPNVKDVPKLISEENMSPSERKFAAEVEYHIRRSIRACPAHIGENIDFTELMIERCVVTRRCRKLYIVWSTVHGSSRLKLEPYLSQLNDWVMRIVKHRTTSHPSLPKIFWVYQTGAVQTELPRKLVHEIKAVNASMNTTMEDRMKHLRQMESLDRRMQGVPWFMPYLWAKDRQMRDTHAIEANAKEMERQRKEKQQKLEAMLTSRPGFRQ